MKLPKQAPAVERKVNKTATIPNGAKTNPAGWTDLITPENIGTAISVGRSIGSLF